MHRKATEQHQGGNDQEATANTDQPGDDADYETIDGDLPERPFAALAVIQAERFQNQRAGEQHDDRKEHKLHAAAQEYRQLGASPERR